MQNQLYAAGRRGTAVIEVDSLMLAGLRGIAGAMMVLSRETTTGEASDRRVRPRYLLCPGTIAKIIGLLTLLAAGLIVHGLPWSHWDGFYELALGFAAALFAAVVVGRRLRHAFIVVASIVLCVAVAEAYALVVWAPAIEIRTPGFSLPHQVLGWGPGHPGVFHDRSLDGKTGSVIYDVDYTIDQYRNRQVISAPTGASVVFFGDDVWPGCAGCRDVAAGLCGRHRISAARPQSRLPRLWAAAIPASARNRHIPGSADRAASVRLSDGAVARRTVRLHEQFRVARATSCDG